MKAAIFDLDGTLIDSTGVWSGVADAFLLQCGITPPPDIDATVSSMSFRDSAVYFIERYRLPHTAEQVMDFWYESVAQKYRCTVDEKPCARAWLQKLHEEGVPIFLVTATDERLARAALERLGMLPYFDHIITVDAFGKSKHFPDIFLHCAALAAAAPQECVVFEDALYAMQTAKQAGFAVWAIADANCRHTAEVHALADRYLDGYADLL